MSDAALRRDAAARIERGLATVVVEIVRSRGSVPREAGTRMLVDAAAIAGTIGGGNLEWRAIARARRMLACATDRPDDEDIALGASLGQCCGGAVTLRYRMLDAASLAAWHAVARVPAIQLYGAGHVGRALVQVLALLDVTVDWIDEREDAFPVAASPPNVGRVCVDTVEAEVAQAPADAFHLVMTHQHDLDLRIVEAILRRDDFAACPFVGLIGSTTKRRRFTQLLRERGLADAALARITCPIGIDGIASKEPAHIAIAVAAQLAPLLIARAAAPGACGEDAVKRA